MRGQGWRDARWLGRIPLGWLAWGAQGPRYWIQPGAYSGAPRLRPEEAHRFTRPLTVAEGSRAARRLYPLRSFARGPGEGTAREPFVAPFRPLRPWVRWFALLGLVGNALWSLSGGLTPTGLRTNLNPWADVPWAAHRPFWTPGLPAIVLRTRPPRTELYHGPLYGWRGLAEYFSAMLAWAAPDLDKA